MSHRRADLISPRKGLPLSSKVVDMPHAKGVAVGRAPKASGLAIGARAKGLFAVGILGLVMLWASVAHAQTTPPPVPPDSWAGQLEALGRWVARRQGATCTERCFALHRLRLTGSVTAGTLRFELEGSLLTDGPFAVPLFGAPARVRVDQTTESGKPAAIGFEGDHYFLFTAARRFLVKGTLTLDDDRVLTIPGPLNSFEAELADGRCVEGARLSGLSSATVHFDRAITKQAVEPTVFQLSRAVRVG